jgi:hypothetical protein
VTAPGVLARAHAAGLAVVADGGNIRLRGAVKPPADLLADLRTHKADVLALLTAPEVLPFCSSNPRVPQDEATASPAALAGFLDHPDALDDRAAIAADTWPAGPRPAAAEPPADLVERLVAATAAPRPWQRIEGDPAPALAYFRGEARRRLDRLDPLARGLLVQAAETEARRWGALAVHAKGTGR